MEVASETETREKPQLDIARPPVYTPYLNPFVKEFVEAHLKGKPYEALTDTYFREPFVHDVRAGKNTPIYNAHSYHTKVPPQGIEPFILHYTEPGDLILDPLAGSGMTGVAALKLGRKALLIELSPAATFIAYNYCTPVDVKAFAKEAERILASVKEEMEWLYETRCRKCSGRATIEYTIWSDIFRCLFCGKEFALWDAAVTPEGKVLKEFPCPHCKMSISKRKAKRTGSVPVRVNYTCTKCGRKEDAVSDFDLERIKEIEKQGIPTELWYPTYRMPEGDESRRNDKIGITHVHHFYTTRNLWALARLWDEIGHMRDGEVDQKLKFAFTSIALTTSKMYAYRESRKGGITKGTLYIPSIQQEVRADQAFFRKAKLLNFINEGSVIISTQSATNLSAISENSIDYIFTDPPFGANLMYSELDFLWNAWLGYFTDTKEEAIINKNQGKGLKEYAEIMARCFAEMHRVLKPGRWMTMVFHNSRGDVWQAIQEGLANAGFDIGSIHTFDKQQGSFKQVTSEGAVGYDVIINSYKPKATLKNGFEGKTTQQAILGFLSDHLKELPRYHCDDRTDRMLHSKMIGFFMQRQVKIDIDFDKVRSLLKDNFKEVDGYWYLWGQIPEPKEGEQYPLDLMGSIKTEADAINWLRRFLEKPQPWKEIHPRFLIALGQNKLQKEPLQILEENFIYDEEDKIWRCPTPDEAEGLNKVRDVKRYKAFRSWAKHVLDKEPASLPSDDVLRYGFEQFFYEEKRYAELLTLLKSVPKEKRENIRELAMIARLAEEKVRDLDLLRGSKG